MRTTLTAILCALTLVACANQSRYESGIRDTSAVSEDELRSVQFASNLSERAVFRGDFNLDDLDTNHAGFLYPGNSGAVFLTSVLAHAATSQAVQSEKEQKIMEAANAVLEPYTESLAGVNGRELFNTAVLEAFKEFDLHVSTYDFSDNPAPPEDGVAIYAESVFFVSQDLSQIRLLSSFYRIAPSGDPAFINASEVHSVLILSERQNEFWGDPIMISSEAEKMLKKSIELVLRDEMGQFDTQAPQQETVKYYFGGQKSYERGEVLDRDCKSTTVRTLRGWIKHVATDPDLIPLQTCQD